MNKELKREIIIDNYNNPFHKEIPNGDFIKINTSSESCIDDLDVYFDIDKDIIKDVYFEGEACAISTSATSIMLRKLIGKDINYVKNLLNNYRKMINEEEYDKDILEDLVVYDDIYLQPNRIGCALIPVKAIEKLLNSLEK